MNISSKIKCTVLIAFGCYTDCKTHVLSQHNINKLFSLAAAHKFGLLWLLTHRKTTSVLVLTDEKSQGILISCSYCLAFFD